MQNKTKIGIFFSLPWVVRAFFRSGIGGGMCTYGGRMATKKSEGCVFVYVFVYVYVCVCVCVCVWGCGADKKQCSSESYKETQLYLQEA